MSTCRTCINAERCSDGCPAYKEGPQDSLNSVLTIELARLAAVDTCERLNDFACNCAACGFWYKFGERLRSKGFVPGSPAFKAWERIRGDL